METPQEKHSFIARLWNFLTVQFSSEGGGSGSFLTLFLILTVFIIVVITVFKDVLIVTIPFLIFACTLLYKSVNKFFGLAEGKTTQKLFYPPEQRATALRLEYKYGSDSKRLAPIKGTDKFTTVEFPKTEEGHVIEEGQ